MRNASVELTLAVSSPIPMFAPVTRAVYRSEESSAKELRGCEFSEVTYLACKILDAVRFEETLRWEQLVELRVNHQEQMRSSVW